MDSKYEIARPLVSGAVFIGCGFGVYFAVKKLLQMYWDRKDANGG